MSFAKGAKSGGDKSDAGKAARGKHRGQPKVYDKKGRDADRTARIVKKSGGGGKGGAADGLDRWG